MNQTNIPLLQQLFKHRVKRPISFHVPGHKNGMVVPAPARHHFSEFLSLDVTELSGLDDLHSPEGVIAEAEELLAQLYQVQKSYFLVNGSTVGNLAMILAAVGEGDTVLVQRNCHKSIINGLSLAKANPVFLAPEYDEEWGVAGGVSCDLVEEALMKYPHAKALILTYPNYYGMVYPLEEMIAKAHEKGIPVLVDEAHGAHFYGSEIFPPSAVELKADIVIQSAHKTLPAMTMGAYLHMNSTIVAKERVEHYLRILQSSSPSYPIMASLDFARSYLASFSNEDGKALMQTINHFRDQLDSIKGISVLRYANQMGDPLKITIQSNTALTGFDLQRLLEERSIFTELADPFNVLMVFPLVKKGEFYPFEEVLRCIKDNMKRQEMYGDKEIKKRHISHHAKITTLSRTDRKEVKTVKIDEACGKICAQLILPYPPGIPLLFPGEIITKEHIQHLHELLQAGARFQDVLDLQRGLINIYQ